MSKAVLGVRRLIVFDPETMPPIPKNLHVKPEEAAPYANQILAEWCDRSIQSDIQLGAQIAIRSRKTVSSTVFPASDARD